MIQNETRACLLTGSGTEADASNTRLDDDRSELTHAPSQEMTVLARQTLHYQQQNHSQRTLHHSQLTPEASISIWILGPDPTTFEAYRVHPISRPDQVLGRCWRRPYTAMETLARECHISHRRTFISLHCDGKSSPPAVIFQPKIHKNALPAGAPPRTGPTGAAYSDPKTTWLDVGQVRE